MIIDMKHLNLNNSGFFSAKGRRSRGVRAARTLMWSAFMVPLLLMGACEDDPEDYRQIPVPSYPEVSLPTYMTVAVEASKDVDITRQGRFEYAVSTTGTDPQLILDKLAGAFNADSCVLTFEYRSDSTIRDVELYFAEPLSATRMMKASPIPASRVSGEETSGDSDAWAKWSVDLGFQAINMSWGAAKDYLRIDLGQKEGIDIEIRNIHFRPRTAEEAATGDILDQLVDNKANYLTKTFESAVSNVNVTTDKVTISGTCSGEGSFSLVEIAPYMVDGMFEGHFESEYMTEVSGSFTKELDRFVTRGDFKFDRALSKWAIVKHVNEYDVLVSAARYADQIQTKASAPAAVLRTKKGLGGIAADQAAYRTDYADLGISCTVINIQPTHFSKTSGGGSDLTHEFGGKTYYFDKALVEGVDADLEMAAQNNLVVAAIILIPPASSPFHAGHPEDGALIQHPDFNGGSYTMPNLTTIESANYYAAALDFMAQRYCGNDFSHGRIHHFIMHNEVDMGYSWTNMGSPTMETYVDTYVNSMRIAYNIVRQYDQNAEIFGSFAHSWAVANDAKSYVVKDMLDRINGYSHTEGDFRWALAYHSYPSSLIDPKTWNDAQATFDMDSPMVTFKNLEVLDKWVNMPEHMYKGTTRRSVWLSENSAASPSYSEEDLANQAACFAYAWKKMNMLTGINSIHWHPFDHPTEIAQNPNQRFGLRKSWEDAEEPCAKKPIWFLYQAAGTADEDAKFAPYIDVINETANDPISSWDDILHTVL